MDLTLEDLKIEISPSRGDWRVCAGLFDKLKRRKRNVDGGVLAGLGVELRLYH